MSKRFFELKKHVLPCSYIRQYPKALAQDQEDDLHIAINQYTPLDNLSPQPGDLTIIAGHANGVGKELYEPLFDDLLHRFTTSKHLRIRSIWIADVAWQGESSVLNEGRLGSEPSWYDAARDILHMINHFRRDMPRPLIGIGHSMGGAMIANVSLMHPRLFTGIILIDPVIQIFATSMGNYAPAQASTFRRDIWPSRNAAAESFRRNKFYQRWDPRVLDLWIKYGLRDLPTQLYPEPPPSLSKTTPSSSTTTPPLTASSAAATTTAAPVPPSPLSDPPVTLTTTKHQEVFTFARANHPPPHTPLSNYIPSSKHFPDIIAGGAVTPFYRPEAAITFTQLPFLRPPTLFVFAADSPLSSPALRADKLRTTGTGVSGNGGVAKGGVQSVVIEDTGHFVPFEMPEVTARHVAEWVAWRMDEWRTDEEAFAREWGGKSTREKSEIGDDWKWWMGGRSGEEREKGGKAKL